MLALPKPSELPGDPSARRVKAVKRELAGYGVRPLHTEWVAVWEWAGKIARSYLSLRPIWPRGRAAPRGRCAGTRDG